MQGKTRDHGGNLDQARARFGGTDWIDLSTGINPVAYPMPALPRSATTTLPTQEDIAGLEAAAARTYGTGTSVVALGGAQAAIQLAPRLRTTGRAKVLSPTYNEHAASLTSQGWTVTEVNTLEDIAGADLAVIVNPNNPDGRSWSPETLIAHSETVGLLVVDESFADPHPELSLAPQLAKLGERVLVLRSFGKFYGLAGLRLGFALGGPQTLQTLRDLAGPWAISGPSIIAGRTALTDTIWQTETIDRLTRDTARLDTLAKGAGWHLVGGPALFRTYETDDAEAAQAHLARAAIWTRVFPYSTRWLRMGLPGSEPAWARLEKALAGQSE